MKLFNTLTRQKEEFVPIKAGQVGMYTCGPTVYNYAHIGNLRAYLFDDLLKKTLIYSGYRVKHVMNITDVGHLTSDADEGADKIESVFNVCMRCVHCGKETKTPFRATKEAFNTGSFINLQIKCEHCGQDNIMMHANGVGKSTYNGPSNLYLKKVETPQQIAEFYTKAFKQNLQDLNIAPPNIWCKATAHIKEQIKLIQRLEKNGYTYIGVNGNVYFDTNKFSHYGELARLRVDNLQAGARIEVDPNKKNPQDFVLWFSMTGSKFSGHLLKWPSPWGEGWPGWHLECSAMSMKYLGEHFDIHCGGVDHIAVHHTNEIAQSEGATGKKWVNYWLHNEFLLMDKEKMAKSAGEFITLDTLVKKGFNPLAYRYLCLGAHYRSQLNFSWQSLTGAQNALNNLYQAIASLPKPTKLSPEYQERFRQAISDDLDSPRALAVVWELVKSDLKPGVKLATLFDFDAVLSLDLKNFWQEAKKVPKKIIELIKQRETVRQNKDWSKSDELREQIKKQGYLVDDTPTGPLIKKVN